MLLVRLSFVEECLLFMIGLFLCKDVFDKKVLLVWWWFLFVLVLLCFRLRGGLLFGFVICILFVFEFGVRNKVFIFGGLFNGLFLFGRLLVCKCVCWLWYWVFL